MLMTTYLGPGLLLALVAMELLNHLYMSGAVPQFFVCQTGKLPFSVLFNTMLYVFFMEALPFEVTDQDSAASVAGATAMVYAILQGQKTVATLEEFGHLLPEMIYVFLLVFVMFTGKMIGDGLAHMT